MGIDPAMVDEVIGYNIQESWPDINSKGLENNQSTAVIIIFDDTYNLMQHVGGIGVNTNSEYAYVEPVTTNIKITLSEPVTLDEIGIPLIIHLLLLTRKEAMRYIFRIMPQQTLLTKHYLAQKEMIPILLQADIIKQKIIYPGESRS